MSLETIESRALETPKTILGYSGLYYTAYAISTILHFNVNVVSCLHTLLHCKRLQASSYNYYCHVRNIIHNNIKVFGPGVVESNNISTIIIII